MADDKVRLSQVVGVFGPGAMLDLPERSVLVQGLDHWEMFGTGTFKVIEEPRLARLLHQRLSDDGRLVADRPPELRTPPIDAGDPKRKSPGIKATVFPPLVRLRCDRRRPAQSPPARSLSRSRPSETAGTHG
jgi:hypothetical protein